MRPLAISVALWVLTGCASIDDRVGANDRPRLCGVLQGMDATVQLFESPQGRYAGFAVALGASGKERRVVFPHIEGVDAVPCRGTVHTHDDRTYLFVTNAPPSTIADAEEGLWFAVLPEEGEALAGVMTGASDLLYRAGINAVAAHSDRLYLSVSATPEDAPWVPEQVVGRHSVFVVPFVAETGMPRLRSDGSGARWIGPRMGVGHRNGPCTAEHGHAGIAVAPFHDDRLLVFLGGCAEIAVFDAVTGAPLGESIDATHFGQAFTRFTITPDGRTLFALPRASSPYTGHERPMPIDLSTGLRPTLGPTYAHERPSQAPASPGDGDRVGWTSGTGAASGD
jgi:hypothetical protein